MPSRLSLYHAAAEQAADVVVRRYSTSFGLASRLLPPARRADIRNVYALVRLADEVVDGAAEEADLGGARAAGLLDRLEADVVEALGTGYSINVLVHAFARTARSAGFGTDLTGPFFASMRMDLHRTVHDDDSFAEYVYGSAEVVGLMCLRVFLLDEPADQRDARYARLAAGARALGAAFQKVNFLRDLADDSGRLGRRYFPGIDPGALTDHQKDVICDDIAADLRTAASAVPELPAGARRAVRVAYALFAELLARLRATPAADVLITRASVPPLVKARLVGSVLSPVRPQTRSSAMRTRPEVRP